MTVLIVGASGATGQQLISQLLNKGEKVKAIVRASSTLREKHDKSPNLSLIVGNIPEMSTAELQQHLSDCDAVLSCLGHTLSFKGIYGQPRRLVTNAVRDLCQAIEANNPTRPVKFILMNTTGNCNRDLVEPISFAQHCVIGLLRLLLPPHVDNEQAADFLRIEIGPEHKGIEWVAVRPDGLVDEDDVTEYQLHASPTRSAIFDSGQTSRINVGHFMAELVVDDGVWQRWKGRMPVIYNSVSDS
jgi:nucleoside-diphosphate-sugar epimerase